MGPGSAAQYFSGPGRFAPRLGAPRCARDTEPRSARWFQPGCEPFKEHPSCPKAKGVAGARRMPCGYSARLRALAERPPRRFYPVSRQALHPELSCTGLRPWGSRSQDRRSRQERPEGERSEASPERGHRSAPPMKFRSTRDPFSGADNASSHGVRPPGIDIFRAGGPWVANRALIGGAGAPHTWLRNSFAGGISGAAPKGGQLMNRPVKDSRCQSRHPHRAGREPDRGDHRRQGDCRYGAGLVLSEASYRPVIYIPRRDVDMALLERSARTAPIAPTRATPPISASLPAANAVDECRVDLRGAASPRSPRSRTTSPSIPITSIRSRSGRRVSASARRRDLRRHKPHAVEARVGRSAPGHSAAAFTRPSRSSGLHWRHGRESLPRMPRSSSPRPALPRPSSAGAGIWPASGGWPTRRSTPIRATSTSSSAS